MVVMVVSASAAGCRVIGLLVGKMAVCGSGGPGCGGVVGGGVGWWALWQREVVVCKGGGVGRTVE